MVKLGRIDHNLVILQILISEAHSIICLVFLAAEHDPGIKKLIQGEEICEISCYLVFLVLNESQDITECAVVAGYTSQF